MLKKLLLIIVGIGLGGGGYWAAERYLMPMFFEDDAPLQETVTSEPEVVAPTPVLGLLPYGMVLGETRFEDKPLFCLEDEKNNRPVGSGDSKNAPVPVLQHCRVTPGFEATFTRGVLSKISWDMDKQARLHKEWRAVGLNSNQLGSQFLEIITQHGASNFRDERETPTMKLLTWDIGPMSYRLWLVSKAKSKVKSRNKKTRPPLYFKRLETILSF